MEPEDHLIWFRVVKVKRKYAALIRTGLKYDYCEEVDINTGRNKGDCNAGYNFYLSLNDWSDHMTILKKERAIADFFRRYKSPTPEQVEAIHEILFTNEGT